MWDGDLGIGTGVWGYGEQGQWEMHDHEHKDTMIRAWGHRDMRSRTSIYRWETIAKQLLH